jgi:hypothetical protein
MRVILLINFLLPLMVAAQIGSKTQPGKIYGIWQNAQFGYQMRLILNADGKGEFDGETISFISQGSKLTIVQGGMSTEYMFLLSENSLTLSGGDLDEPVMFTRNGTQAPPALSNATTDVKSPSNITSESLMGIWSGNGETIEFMPEGQCIYLGNTFFYKVSEDQITLTTTQGNAMFAYKIIGDQLTLTANGRQLVYRRGAANSQPTAEMKGGNIAQELVGKWCWTNVTSTNSGGSSSSECIVLNANGTYEFASERSMDTNTNAFYAGTSSQGADRGTWWVQGDRIFYNSESRGQGSYQLQKQNHPKTGDPMILLNGDPYVTFYQKQPWR